MCRPHLYSWVHYLRVSVVKYTVQPCIIYVLCITRPTVVLVAYNVFHFSVLYYLSEAYTGKVRDTGVQVTVVF